MPSFGVAFFFHARARVPSYIYLSTLLSPLSTLLSPGLSTSPDFAIFPIFSKKSQFDLFFFSFLCKLLCRQGEARELAQTNRPDQDTL